MLSETTRPRIAVLLHAAVAFVIGWLSSQLTEAWYAVVLALLVLYGLGTVSHRTYGKGKERNWWLGNGAFVYIFLWFSVWVYFVNAAG